MAESGLSLGRLVICNRVEAPGPSVTVEAPDFSPGSGFFRTREKQALLLHMGL
jgi:hypothetical protein